ncbi:hypothetical protein ACRFA2_19245 [Bacteroides hominis]|uniref:hypothetical protein n=1 Tax=Bacteroides hominis TaxID=2763023 RepID=UPI002949D63B|nr:hypothetical protein [Bacteroides hominis (ex Liu et al. 2022)]MDV6172587.1 hypothetical protein [Bacteroides hominis (ex Liu et al. 2022)]
MKTTKKWTGYLFLCLFCLHVSAQNKDSLVQKLSQYACLIENFSKHIPQEKVYLQFDNTSYYQGDDIWFKCFLVTSDLYPATNLSKTLYVELLNPGGEIIDKRILKIENGQCHGDFTLNQIPFYSGFYEVRAYTKYMLNFGEDIIFSRLLPVFDKPQTEGNFAEKEMRKYSTGNYPMERPKPTKGKKVNLKFFPESGNLIQGIESQIAFEATDAYGNPITLSGTVINDEKQETAHFTAIHDGRGVFNYTPTGDKQKAVVEFNGKKHQFNMPEALPAGYALHVDNLSYTDSVEIALQKNPNTPATLLGLAVISGGKLHKFCLIDVEGNEIIRFKIDKSRLTPGVSRIALFNGGGEVLSDRLIFIHPQKRLSIKARTDKETYNPYELVNLEFTLTGAEMQPVQNTFALSVRDGMNEVESGRNILTDLLLMSEIKGYIRNPGYYFEAEDDTHRMAIDLLLRIQGWRRYSWKQMTGIEPLNLKYGPERGIETQGQVVSFVRQLPKPNVEVSCFLKKRGENEENSSFIEAITTDSLGRFSLISDIYGKWDLILAVTVNRKKKDYRILLDRLFSPPPAKYHYADMQVNIANTKKEEDTIPDKETNVLTEDDIETFFAAYTDSLAKAGNHEKNYRLKEVTIKAKKRSKEKEIYDSRSKSIAYYDVHSELDDIKDSGKFIGDDIHELMLNMNKNFSPVPQRNYLYYKSKMPLFVINYECTRHTEMDYNKYKYIRLEAIKSIYITENLSTICRYADPRLSPFDVSDLYGCAVLIETYPEGKIPTEAGKGVRKTWLDGYSPVKEFYQPNYSALPPVPDYRRTLYWNPSVSTDKDGKAHIRFYNNSRCRKLKINAETITADGLIGIYEN